MDTARKESVLRAYEVYIPTNTSLVEEVFGGVLLVMLAACLGLGWYFHTIKALPEPLEQKLQEIKTRFVIEEKKKPPVKPIEKKKDAEQKPIDLTSKPLLNQKLDDAVKEVQPKGPVVRRVYGLRRVYSVGIGSQGGNEEAVIGKLGNTLNKEVDTLTATKDDIKGRIVPVSTITAAPELTNGSVVKPEYTKEMIEAKIEGVVKATLLIDIDGSVKEVKILSDLGLGSADRAKEAFLKWKFKPAMKDGKPVAVWITYSIRFVLLQ